MPATVTPIRYPGGKTKIYNFVCDLLAENDLNGGTYCEPFAGGAGLALKLLLNNNVNQIYINDADPAIFSIWDLILHNSDELCTFVESVNIDVAEWELQRKIYTENYQKPSAELGKAAFFLNRTNVSGIITGGIIGGREQKGNYKIDARFNKKNLVKKIRRIASASTQIHLYNMDVLDFIENVFPELEERTLINFDPPYVNKGDKLYKNAFTLDDHKKLRDRITQCHNKWIVTYDICDFIKDLYKNYRGDYINVYYSANEVKKAQEYVFFSNDLKIPQ